MTRTIITLIAAMAAAALTASNVSAQVYDVTVPEPQGFTSTSSKLAGSLSDAAGNTLYVIDHEDVSTSIIAGDPRTDITPKGRQWLLLDRTGKLLGAESFAEASADRPSTVVFFSARRILARLAKSNNVSMKEFVPADGRIQPRGQAIVISALIGSGRSELTREAPSLLPAKFFDVAERPNGKVTRVVRFDATKVTPPNN